jgi:hypothetical protein
MRYGLVISAFAFAAMASAQDGVLLRRALKPSKDTYTLKMKSVNKMYIEMMGGEQEATVDGTMKILVTLGEPSPTKKANPIELMFSEMKFELGGMAAMGQGAMDGMPQSYKMTGFLDEMNRFSDVKVEVADQMALMMTGMDQMRNTFFFELPEGAVKPGDTWTIKIAAGGMTKEATPADCKFIGEEAVDGTTAYKVEMTATMKIDQDMSQMAGDAAGGMKMFMKGTNTMKTTMWLEKETGRLLKTSTKAVGDQTMEMPDMNMTMPVKSETTATMTLVKK